MRRSSNPPRSSSSQRRSGASGSRGAHGNPHRGAPRKGPSFSGDPRTGRTPAHSENLHSSRPTRGQRGAHSHPLPQIDVNPEPIEGHGDYARRTKAQPFAVVKQARRKMRGIVIALIVLAVTIAVAFYVGSHVFFKTTDANFEDVQSNAAEALSTASSAEGPTFFLLEADLTFKDHAKNMPDARSYMVVRLDDAAHTVSFLTIPARLQVSSTEGDAILLEDAKAIGGDAETIAIVSELLGQRIDHFVSTNADGLSRLVDAIGGVEVEIPSEIDDPNAGTRVIPAGVRTLDGAEALIYLRDTNHAKGLEQTSHNRIAFTYLLLAKALDTKGFDFANIISEASNFVTTDMATNYLMDVANASRPLSDLALFESLMPVAENTLDGKVVYKLNAKEWEAFKGSFVSGGNTDAINDASIPSGEVSVEVRNGANIDGAGARLGSILQGYGYTIGGIGNTNDGIIYPETLVIYTDPVYEGLAKDIVDEISSGRIVNGGDYYSSDSDVIVIIGSDWSNAA